jgi:hypothetical protein
VPCWILRPAGPTTACSLQLHLQTPPPSCLPTLSSCLHSCLPPSLSLFLSSSLPLFISSCLPTLSSCLHSCLPPSLPLFISSCLPTFLLPSSSLLTFPTNASTRPPSHPRPQQASPLTIKPPSRRSPPRSPSASGVVASPSRRESRVMVWKPFK